MKCHVYVKRKDGIVMPVADLSPDPMPKVGEIISVKADGATVRVRVDEVRRGNTMSLQSGVESVCYITATEL